MQSANGAATALTAGYTAGDATLTVTSNVLFPTSGLLTLLPSRLILRYTGKSSTTGFTGVARASTALEPNNPADQNVASGSTVEQRITSGSLGVLRSAVLALETRLGITTSLPAAWHGLTVVADDQAGADLGAKINAADALLGANFGTILVHTPGTISTAVTLNAGHLLKFGPGTFSQSATITIGGAYAGIQGAGIGLTTIQNTTLTTISITANGSYAWLQLRDFVLTRTSQATLNGGGHGIQFGLVATQYCTIANLHVTNHDIGILLGPVVYAEMYGMRIAVNSKYGLYITNTAAIAGLQWQITDILVESNGNSGIVVQSVDGPGTGGQSMGEWDRIRTFANTGYGIVVSGTVLMPIQSFRLYNSFCGEDANSEINLDTFGSSHRIVNCFSELVGQSLTGVLGATAASHTGHGIEVTANNDSVVIANCIVNQSSKAGIACSAARAVIVGNKCTNNGQVASTGFEIGIYVNCSSGAVVSGNSSLNTSGATQLYGFYVALDTVVLVGNEAQGATAAISFASGQPTASTVIGNKISGASVVSVIPDPLNLGGNVTIAEAKNIALGTTTGTKIGTATTQKLGFWNAAPIVQPTDGAALTNSVTVGGTTNTIADFTNLTVYATDAPAIRNDIYQLARKVKIIDDALRLMGLLS